jgi:hypothetical protein
VRFKCCCDKATKKICVQEAEAKLGGGSGDSCWMSPIITTRSPPKSASLSRISDKRRDTIPSNCRDTIDISSIINKPTSFQARLNAASCSEQDTLIICERKRKKKNREHIPSGGVFGSLGNHFAIKKKTKRHKKPNGHFFKSATLLKTSPPPFAPPLAPPLRQTIDG